MGCLIRKHADVIDHNSYMIQSGFIAAIDLGTSQIKAVLGRMNENKVISVLASETTPSSNCIRRGLVYNVEETGGKVKKLISMLENSVGRKIGRVYVSVAGQSLHSIEHRERKQLSSSGIVTEDVIGQLRNVAEKHNHELLKRYAIADVEYFLDDKAEKNPVGVSCTVIEADYEMIVGRPNLMTNIERSIREKAQMEIAGYTVGALASAAIALNEDEKELGCAFIDFGAGTTTLSIYKGGILRKMVTIPFGGRNITKDICELNFTENDAEQYKIKFGKAYDSNENSLFSPFSSKPDIDLVELNKVIRMRLDEITANLKEQIKLSGYEGQLGAGIIITGGASQLKNLDIYLTEKLKMPVRRASAKKSYVNNSSELANNPAYTQLLGLLTFATEDCEAIAIEMGDDSEEKEAQTATKKPSGGRLWGRSSSKPKEPAKVKKEKNTQDGGGFFTKMENMFGGMFSEEDEDN